MDAYLSHLRKAGALVAPATEAELGEWRACLAGEMPADLLHVYSRTKGSTGAERLAMRLLRFEEVVQDSECIRRQLGWQDTRALQAFWTDDNSNYAGAFLEGPLFGMVAFMDHEELMPVPVYSSVSSFLTALVASPEKDWSELAHEYPRVTLAKNHEMERDRTVRDLFVSRHERDQENVWAAHVALQFVARGDFELVRGYLKSTDMWIQEAACYVTGRLKIDELVGDLEHVALDGMHNGRIRSILALKQIETARSNDALIRLRPRLGREFEPYFR